MSPSGEILPLVDQSPVRGLKEPLMERCSTSREREVHHSDFNATAAGARTIRIRDQLLLTRRRRGFNQERLPLIAGALVLGYFRKPPHQ